MNEITHQYSGTACGCGVAGRRGGLTIALLLGIATVSSVYCQTPTKPDDPPAAETGGWRLAVTQPTPGGRSSRVAVLCYAVSGAAREPELALDITPMRRGDGPAAATVRTDIIVGRASATADLSAAGQGTFDLRVQLVVDGSTVDRPVVVIRGVSLRQDAPRATCS
jgi:hypothetical protein